MPWPVLRTVIVLAVLAAGIGLWLGTRHAQLSETEVINAVADRYVAETGGARSDCAARPSTQNGVWMIINCGTANSISQYWVDHQGRLVTPNAVPET